MELRDYLLENRESIPSDVYDNLLMSVSEVMSHRFEELTEYNKNVSLDSTWKVGWLWCLMGESLSYRNHVLYLGVGDLGEEVVIKTSRGITITELYTSGSLCLNDLLNLITSMADTIDELSKNKS